jgi:hypothetical protein
MRAIGYNSDPFGAHRHRAHRPADPISPTPIPAATPRFDAP